MTIAEFEAQYAGQKPYYEYWFGEAVQKSAATWVHGLLRAKLMELLREAGYKAGSEVTLKIDPGFHPVPDVIATKGAIEIPYPTRAVEIGIEILSDDDPLSRVLTKCRHYEGWGFEEIYVVDSGSRTVLRRRDHRLEEVDSVAGKDASRIWTALGTAMDRKIR